MFSARRLHFLPGLSLLGLLLLTSATAASAQDVQNTTTVPEAARPETPQPAETPTDSTLLLDAASRRVGLTTYSVRSDVRGRVPGVAADGRTTVRYHASTDWLLSSAAGEKLFVRQDSRAELSAERRLGKRPVAEAPFTLGPLLQHIQNPSIQTAISTAAARATWRGRLPTGGGGATDSLSPASVRVGVLAGLRRDARQQYVDTGPAVGADVAALWTPPGAPAGSSPVRFYGRAIHATLGPRSYTRASADAAWELISIGPASADGTPGAVRSVQMGAGWRFGRIDDYLSGNIQRIRSDTLTARLGLTYPLTKALIFRSENIVTLPARSFAYRPVPGADLPAARLRNSSFEQRELLLRQEARGQWRRLRGGMQFSYQERQRSYDVQSGRLDSTTTQLAIAARQETLKDVRERTSAWTTDAEWAPIARRPDGPRHVFSTRTTAQILHLDTPSDQNQQDRDEVYYQGRVQWAANWDPTFRTTLAVAAEYRQFIYIKAIQTAENYTERVVAYEPGFRWQPGRFGWKAEVQLRAIYQVRALTSEQARNRATRLLQWQQEWTYRLPAGRREWLLTATYQRRESRFAVLRWPDFKESPLDTTVANDYLVAVRHALPVRLGRSGGLSHALRIGYRFFEQRVHQTSGLAVPNDAPRLIYRRDFTWQHGPEIRYERALPARGLLLNAAVWLQRITTFRRYQEGKGVFSGATFTPADFPNRARRTDPYFDVGLTWRWR